MADHQQSKFEDFRMTQKLGEGTFSEVLKVKHKVSGKIYAMKRFRKRFNSTFEEIQNLREIQALRRLNPHNHVIDLIEVIFDQKHGVLALNFELMDCNLYELISRKNVIITEAKAKNYFYQICKGLEYMHSKGIFHRDIKPENILIKDTTIKLADFGSCRGIHSKQPYTEYIATRWYRSPECLLCDGIYNFKMDIWGAGCVLYEIISKAPLFPGSNELDQFHRIHAVVGTPSPKLLKKMLGNRSNAPEYSFPPKEGTGIRALLPHVSADCIDLVNAMLSYDPDLRISSKEVLRHTFFKDLQYNEGTIHRSETLLASKNISVPTQKPRPEDTKDVEQSQGNPYLKKHSQKVDHAGGPSSNIAPAAASVAAPAHAPAASTHHHQQAMAHKGADHRAIDATTRTDDHAGKDQHQAAAITSVTAAVAAANVAPSVLASHEDPANAVIRNAVGTHAHAQQQPILIAQQQAHRTIPVQPAHPPEPSLTIQGPNVGHNPAPMQQQQHHHAQQHHPYHHHQQHQPQHAQPQPHHAQLHHHQPDNSDSASVISTASTSATSATNATNVTNMSTTYYNKVRQQKHQQYQQAEERAALEAAMARARRAKKRAAAAAAVAAAGGGGGNGSNHGGSSAGSRNGSKRGSANNRGLMHKNTWQHGGMHLQARKSQTKLPALGVGAQPSYKEYKESIAKNKIDPRAANLPLLSISSMNADKRAKDAGHKAKEFVTLPSLSTDKHKVDALNLGLAIGNTATTTLPAIKPRPKDYH